MSDVKYVFVRDKRFAPIQTLVLILDPSIKYIIVPSKEGFAFIFSRLSGRGFHRTPEPLEFWSWMIGVATFSFICEIYSFTSFYSDISLFLFLYIFLIKLGYTFPLTASAYSLSNHKDLWMRVFYPHASLADFLVVLSQ